LGTAARKFTAACSKVSVSPRPRELPAGSLVALLNAWRRFWLLRGAERSTVIAAAFELLATWFALRILGFRRWKNILDRRSSVPLASAAADSDQLTTALRIARLQSAAARHILFRTNCLEQAMTLCYALRRRGIAADLRFGARKESARLEAHAWVEVRGVPLNEDQGEHRHFLPFDNPMMETLPD